MYRRRAIRLGLGAALGRLGGVEATDGREDSNETGASDDGSADRTSVTTVQIGATQSAPGWYEGSAPGAVTVIDDERRLSAVVRRRSIPDRRAAAAAALAERTDFETAVLLLVESVGPNACYREIEVSNVSVRRRRGRGCRRGERTVFADAAAVDACEGDVLAAAVITYPAALARVKVPGAVPRSAAVTITDGWGETETITASADDPLPPVPDDRPE